MSKSPFELTDLLPVSRALEGLAGSVVAGVAADRLRRVGLAGREGRGRLGATAQILL